MSIFSTTVSMVLTIGTVVATAATPRVTATAGAAELPTVTVTAVDGVASEADAADTGGVAITRSGDTGAALDVDYTTRYSTADRGPDYRHPAEGTPNGWVTVTHIATIPAGESSVTLPIVARQDTVPEIAETVQVLLSQDDRAYAIGDPDDAEVSIIDDESPRAPAAPTGLSATRASATQVNLAWNDTSTNESGFTVEERRDGSSGFTPLATLPLRSSVHTTSLPAGTGAAYRVVAFNEVGTSAPSGEAVVAVAPPATPSWLEHVRVAGEPGRTKGWPTNNGMWSWGNEIVVMYDDTEYRESAFTHAFAFHRPVLAEQARSLDGGRTWTVERDPIVKPGAPGWPADGNNGPPITNLPSPVDFRHPDFAMHVRMSNKDYGPSYWYYSYDRARTWNGPYRLPTFGLGTVNARQDYVVDGPNEVMLFLSGTTSTNNEGKSRPFAVRSTDGGMTWTFLSWMDAEARIQPSTVRISPTKLVSATRTDGGVQIVESRDNGASWEQTALLPAGSIAGGTNSPGTLVRLADGRLVLVHGYRRAPFGVRTRISADDGRTWSDEVVLRQDGGSFDVGYTRAVLRPDGKIVVAYYFNTDSLEERTIEATIFDPEAAFATTLPPASTSTTTTTSTTSTTTTTAAPPAGATSYLSDLQWVSAKNGYGPVERNRSVGTSAAGDGGPIRIGGTTHPKGLGTHPRAEITYSLARRYVAFRSYVGIDAVCGGAGSVDFEVYLDGVKRYGRRVRGREIVPEVSLDTSTTETLRLVVTDGGDGYNCDHADWGEARLLAAGTPPPSTTAITVPPTTSPPSTTTTSTSTTTTTTPAPTTTNPPAAVTYLSDLVASPAVNGFGPARLDLGNHGLPIRLDGTTSTKGIGVYPRSDLTYDLGRRFSRFVARFGIDDVCGGSGSVVFRVFRDTTKVLERQVTGQTPAQSVSIDTTGTNRLRLVVEDVGGRSCEFSDWADARLLR